MVFLAKWRWIIYIALLTAMVISGNVRNSPRKEIVVPVIQLPIPPLLPAQTASPSASAKPALSYSEMNHLYGPCVKLPVIMYHHVQPASEAREKGQSNLNIDSEVFRKQMEDLKTKGYISVLPSDLVAYFDEGKPLPGKPVMITFDDGYVDNGEYAYEILKQVAMKGVVFLSTGLMENEGYLKWEKIMEMNGSGVIAFGNHTWSHMNAGKNKELVKKEISTADDQLSERGLNQVKTFAYPYGEQNGYTREYLNDLGYKLGFTTVRGDILCNKSRFSLPRIRASSAGINGL